MNRIKKSLGLAAAAARENFLPGIFLQFLMLVFLVTYLTHDGTRAALGQISRIKEESGYLFAFASYVAAAALLPELLRIAFFQKGKPSRKNLWLFLTAAPAWGLVGMAVDLLYRWQSVWFGDGHGIATLLPKIAVDQFVVSPLVFNPFVIAWFLWRDNGFRSCALRKFFRWDFVSDILLPVQVSGWMIWVPGVALVYFMPPPLQIPVASLIQTFWALVLMTVRRESA